MILHPLLRLVVLIYVWLKFFEVCKRKYVINKMKISDEHGRGSFWVSLCVCVALTILVLYDLWCIYFSRYEAFSRNGIMIDSEKTISFVVAMVGLSYSFSLSYLETKRIDLVEFLKDILLVATMFVLCAITIGKI